MREGGKRDGVADMGCRATKRRRGMGVGGGDRKGRG